MLSSTVVAVKFVSIVSSQYLRILTCLLGPCTWTSGKEKLSKGSLVCWHRGESHTEVEEKEKGSARFPT